MKIKILFLLLVIYLPGLTQTPSEELEAFMESKKVTLARYDINFKYSDSVIFIARNGFLFGGNIIVLNHTNPILYKVKEDTIQKKIKVYRLKKRCIDDDLYQAYQLLSFEPFFGIKGSRMSHDYEIQIAIKTEYSFVVKKLNFSEINLPQNLPIKNTIIELGKVKARCYGSELH